MKIEDHEAFKQDLPRMCSILGGEDNPLKVGERFKLNPLNHEEFYVDAGGVMRKYSDDTINGLAIFYAIEHPEKIIRQPQFSEDDNTVLKALFLMGYKYAARDKSGVLCGFMVTPFKDNESGEQWWADEDKWSCSQNNDLLKPIQWSDVEPFDIGRYLEGLK